MHLGVILEHSDPARGGAEAYATALLQRVRAKGHQVTVRARTGPDASPVASWPSMFRPRFYATTFLPALREAGAEKILTLTPVPGCDFYQPHQGIYPASIPPHYEPLPQPLRSLRKFNPVRRLHFAVRRHFEKLAVAPPTRVLALSPRVVADLKEHYPHAQEPLLLRAGVDLDRFVPADRAERVRLRAELDLPEGPLLVFVATNFRLKGLATALRAIDRLPGVTLAVTGDDASAPYQLRSRALSGRVLWRGRDPRLPELLRTADLLIHPTYYDTASLVVPEALASGTPAITTVRDGNADLAAQCGRALADPADDGALARAIGELLAEDRDALATRARTVAEPFESERRLDEVVEAVCGSSS